MPDVTIEAEMPYATVIVTTLDGELIKTSKRVLVQVGTTARLGGWQTKAVKVRKDKQTLDGEEIVNTGTPPWRVANTKATVSVRNAGLTRARMLDVAGYPAGDAPVKKSEGGVEVKLPGNAMYLVLD
jgi:hypothetical protein